jgi:hypothetical protein
VSQPSCRGAASDAPIWDRAVAQNSDQERRQSEEPSAHARAAMPTPPATIRRIRQASATARVNCRSGLKNTLQVTDAAVMEDSSRLLFQTPDVDEAQMAVDAGYYYKDGVEYERLFVTAGIRDLLRPHVKQYIVRGYPKAA